MSIRDFHSQLVSGNNKNNLFGVLRKLSQVADPKSLFTDEPATDWPYWAASERSRLQPASA
jgi:hypothetical protein